MTPYLIKAAIFVREILNPALAIASSLSDDSTVLKDLVLSWENMYYIVLVKRNLNFSFNTYQEDHV